MMFLLVVLFWHFLKFHLRLKYDINEGVKCVEQVQVSNDPSVQLPRQRGKIKVQSAYGELKLPLAGQVQSIKPMDRLRIEYLPLSTHVINWEKAEV